MAVVAVVAAVAAVAVWAAVAAVAAVAVWAVESIWPLPKLRIAPLVPRRLCTNCRLLDAQKGVADSIREVGFALLTDLMANFAKAGGRMFVCSPCFKKPKLDENNSVDGAAVVAGAKLVEIMSDGACPSVRPVSRPDRDGHAGV